MIRRASCIALLVSHAFLAGPAAGELFRAVNVGGPAVTIDGRRWADGDARWFRCWAKDHDVSDVRLRPAVEGDMAKMLHTCRRHDRTTMHVDDVPDGVYSVYVYLLSDAGPRTFDAYAQRSVAVRAHRTGPAGTWEKIGPWAVEARHGRLLIRTRGREATLCGLEIHRGRVEGAKDLTGARQAPVSPYLGKFAGRKPRLVVMTDIGGDPDDRQSLVRLLLYACDFDIEGLCTGLGTGHKRNTREDLIHQAIDEYAKVVGTLRRHREGYPTPDALRGLVKAGRDHGMHEVGEGMDTEASDWILQVMRRKDPRPVWFAVWGGPRELAQALWTLRRTAPPAERRAVERRMRVYSVGDQDRTALYVKEHHPDVWWVLANIKGFYQGGEKSLVSPAWLRENVLDGHGPLAGVYPPEAAGSPGVKEGDTPSFLYVLRTGLSDPEAPHWGSWGGRFVYARAGSEFLPAGDRRAGGRPDVAYTIRRWRRAYQNAFAARMDWCVRPPGQANHTPRPAVNGRKGLAALHLPVESGEAVALDATGTTDPDGDELSYRWWIYPEPGTCEAQVELQDADTPRASVTWPEEAAGTLHVILEVTDAGSPPLTAYRRVILRRADAGDS